MAAFPIDNKSPLAQGRTGGDRTVGGAMATIDSGLAGIKQSSNLERMQAALADMRGALETIKAQAGGMAGPYEAKVQDAASRVAAQTFLTGAPQLPTPTIVRDPESSSTGTTFDERRRAKAIGRGYSDKPPSIVENVLRYCLKYFFGAQPTPAFDKLDAPTKKTFLALHHAMGGNGQIALNGLLTSGKLTPGLLAGLKTMAIAPMAKGIDRATLLSQTLVELRDPVTIHQHGRGTCAATSIQILTAMQRPELYVSLLTGLASPAGKVTLPAGAVLEREDDWDYAGDGGRSIPGRLMQPALLELANGEKDYLNRQDADRDTATNQTAPGGLEASQALPLMNQLMLERPDLELVVAKFRPDLPKTISAALNDAIAGTDDMLKLLQNPAVASAEHQSAMVSRIAATATPEKPIYCTIIFVADKSIGKTVYHAVLVTGIKDGKVQHIDPNGRVSSLSVAQFTGSLVHALLPAEAS